MSSKINTTNYQIINQTSINTTNNLSSLHKIENDLSQSIENKNSYNKNFDTFTKSNSTIIDKELNISQMYYKDGSADFKLDAVAPENFEREEIIIELSPEAKRYKSEMAMWDEELLFIEQMKSDAFGMDYYESIRFVKSSFKELHTDWMNNKPEFFKIWFDKNEERIANKEWNMISMPDGWTDGHFDYWKNYDPWGINDK